MIGKEDKMHDKIEMLHELCDTISRELDEANEKIRKAGGKLSAGDIDYIDKLTHSLKSVKTTLAMMEAEDDDGYSGRMPYNMGYYSRTMDRGNSYARGRNARRDSMGRYSRNYSRDEGMVEQLREIMEDAPSEHIRQKIQNVIMEMEKMWGGMPLDYKKRP